MARVATVSFEWNHYARDGGPTRGRTSDGGKTRTLRMCTVAARRKTWHCENCGVQIAHGTEHWTNDYAPHYDRLCMRCGEQGATE